MGMDDQFKGLDMKNLIGAPLEAAAEANLYMAQTTAQFIEKVGFDSQEKIRTAEFKYTKKINHSDGTITDQEMSIEIPLLAITEAPNLQVDEVNVLFDMEVKEVERTDSPFVFKGAVDFGTFKAEVGGSISRNSKNVQSTDNSKNYQVDIKAATQDIPEGVVKVLNMITSTVESTIEMHNNDSDEEKKN